MAQEQTRRLKVYCEEMPSPPPAHPEEAGAAADALAAFERLTGWRLRRSEAKKPCRSSDLTWSAPVNPGVGVTLGHLRLEPVGSAADGRAALAESLARPMADSLAAVIGELHAAEHALWQREAELAAGVPVTAHQDEAGHLASRLEAVLRSGAQAIGCQAAAAYLLDDTTAWLKLRASWGLPLQRMTRPPRALQGEMADLEAMLGHAVSVDGGDWHSPWKSPEDYPAALCVPLATPTNILGTLWFFASPSRPFTDDHVAIAEVVAGRMAAELERENLLAEAIAAKRLQSQLADAARLQRNQLPSIAPLVEDWDFAGWADHSAMLGGSFFDWFSLPGGRIALVAGRACAEGPGGALIASSLRAAVRSHAQYLARPDELLRQVNLLVWTGSAGDVAASLFWGSLDTRSGRLDYSMAGTPSAIVLTGLERRVLSGNVPLLGESPETPFQAHSIELPSASALVVCNGSNRRTRRQTAGGTDADTLALALAGLSNQPAKHLLATARHFFEQRAGGPGDGQHHVADRNASQRSSFKHSSFGDSSPRDGSAVDGAFDGNGDTRAPAGRALVVVRHR